MPWCLRARIHLRILLPCLSSVDSDGAADVVFVVGVELGEIVEVGTLFKEDFPGTRIACVTDQFGGTAGVVTRGDVLEEIVRDVDEEEEGAIRKVGAHTWLIKATTSLEEVNYELGLSLDRPTQFGNHV